MARFRDEANSVVEDFDRMSSTVAAVAAAAANRSIFALFPAAAGGISVFHVDEG